MINKVFIKILHYTRSYFPGVLFLLLLMGSCRNDPKEIKALVSKSALQEDKAYDVTFIISEHGVAKVRIYAKEFIRNDVAKPPFTDMKKSIRVEFFDDSLHVTNTLTAHYARYYEKQGNVLLRDSIVVKNIKGETLKTQELVWNQNIKKYFTEKPVSIQTPTQILYGDGLEANEDFSWYEIKHPTGVVQVNKSELPQ